MVNAVQIGLGFIQLGLGLGQLDVSRIQLRVALLQGLPRAVYFSSPAVQLGLVALNLAAPLGNLLAGAGGFCFQLGPPVRQFPASVLQLLLGIGQLPLVLLYLPFSVFQFGKGPGQFLAGLRFRVLILPPAIGQLGVGLVHQFLIAEPGAFSAQGLQRFFRLGGQVFVFRVESV